MIARNESSQHLLNVSKDLPEAQIFFDLSMIAPFLTIPSVCPVPASNSLERVTWTEAGMIMGRISWRIGRRDVIICSRCCGTNLKLLKDILVFSEEPDLKLDGYNW